jgi:ubiquinone/menaquinone biosynthesis C-methylase UbiE
MLERRYRHTSRKRGSASSSARKAVMRRVIQWVRQRFEHGARPPSTTASYWDRRARQLGARAVYNIGHPVENLGKVDEQQRLMLLPLLQGLLDGTERNVLDLGCGTGRFSSVLAELTQGRVKAIDVSREMLAMAPKNTRVEYLEGSATSLPFPESTFDLVWACLVLGAVRGEDLHAACGEILRVSRPGGLLFLVENTTNRSDGPSWAFRSSAEYMALLPRFDLRVLSGYLDLGESITVMAGRRRCEQESQR